MCFNAKTEACVKVKEISSSIKKLGQGVNVLKYALNCTRGVLMYILPGSVLVVNTTFTVESELESALSSPP